MSSLLLGLLRHRTGLSILRLCLRLRFIGDWTGLYVQLATWSRAILALIRIAVPWYAGIAWVCYVATDIALPSDRTSTRKREIAQLLSTVNCQCRFGQEESRSSPDSFDGSDSRSLNSAISALCPLEHSEHSEYTWVMVERFFNRCL